MISILTVPSCPLSLTLSAGILCVKLWTRQGSNTL